MSHAALRERQGSVAARTALAADDRTSPELLTFLAADPAPEVRAAVAANAATPPQAGLLLAEDAETEVREALARRIGRLAPGLTAAAQDRLARMTGAILGRLVEDAAVAVRAALSDAVAGLPDAPRDLILRLARDTALPVAEPVLRLSPLLTEEDLLALVSAPPAAFTRRLVAARPRLTEPVTEALAGTTDAPAIAALLANPSAAIREATLDRLAAGSAGQDSWQAALVRRPRLPARAARALGEILAAHLLQALASRPDLPEGLAETLRPRIEAHLAESAASQGAAREAARSGDRAALSALLAAATGFGEGRVEAALALRSPRAIAALCWRAGWTAELAEEVQSALGVPRPRVLRANVEGSWTLSPAELQWQIELLEELPA
ncbi:hypothetical protein DFH01_15095 [Falsiroseomonas bella]|uniref:DUF2336 domain-containing protein n=1 Tax=Falsiroseomonas bella TaxID=2184016 RepID=A0A317FBK5_9PROT|nr:DUF2336 domain-containing protein [Falsiroseomonas bella]PWS36474.1 hypothetical protein DFH01_15095 [Falsiroseomonas bella]